jgi:hypothetical protein
MRGSLGEALQHVAHGLHRTQQVADLVLAAVQVRTVELAGRNRARGLRGFGERAGDGARDDHPNAAATTTARTGQ